ncbi:hypothetical protein [Pseudoleptotrichia goodfellowii]|uniref:Uncharacterized protein n=2 Tax=Pseudoleptotrichia goodfellowii TaxID=157692 RepID=A0A510JCZ1_9FUSO|nr:hypothetical protein [Pseudoleptotrichia goodfellowii]MBF4805928.1 hypothetical protein [Pseudoleptotrichia goodfellowii]BBM37168.1 hypothetical protein JCM16774_2127 [Pseudoleptotrichia goodfellowii]
MNIEYKLYPYPVLNYFSDDYINSVFTSNLKLDKLGNGIIFELTANTDDEGLKELIGKGLAEYVFHIECSSTSYRNIVKSATGTETVTIPESKLNNRVNVCFFIVAKKEIENYSNVNFNPDYEGISFTIEKANILAIAKQYNVEIEKEKDNLAQVPSIFLIIKRESDRKDGIEIEMLQDKLQISLSKKDYEHYALLSKGNYQALLHSSIIFPALIYVFENLKKSDLEIYEDFNWFKTIKKVLNNIDIELDKESLERELSYNLAQKIINFPVSRSLQVMTSLETEEEEIE